MKRNITLAIFLSLVVSFTFLRAGSVERTTDVVGDINGDLTVDISDAVYLLRHLFSDGSPPVAFVFQSELVTYDIIGQPQDPNLNPLGDPVNFGTITFKDRSTAVSVDDVIDFDIRYFSYHWTLSNSEITGNGLIFDGSIGDEEIDIEAGRIWFSYSYTQNPIPIAFFVLSEVASHPWGGIVRYPDSGAWFVRDFDVRGFGPVYLKKTIPDLLVRG